MKRILEVNVDDKGYGGVFAFVMSVMKYIDHDKFVLDIASFEPFEVDEHKESIRSYGGDVYECIANGNYIFKQLRSCYKYYKLLKHNSYSIIHIHSDVAYKLLLYGWIGKIAGVSDVFVHSHSSGVEGRLRTLKKSLHLMTKPILSNLLFTKLACSKIAADWMYTKDCESKIHFVKNGINLEKFIYDPNKQKKMREELGINPKEKVIGTVARFSYQKYPEKLLAVFREIIKISPHFKLLWIGSGPLQEMIKKQSDAFGISDKIIFYGNTERVADLYQAMDVFTLTSRFEGLCISAIEAQASGVQCVCSDALSPETNMSSNYHTMSIDLADNEWANELIKYANISKFDTSREIRDNGYDIYKTVDELANLYCKERFVRKNDDTY